MLERETNISEIIGILLASLFLFSRIGFYILYSNIIAIPQLDHDIKGDKTDLGLSLLSCRLLF